MPDPLSADEFAQLLRAVGPLSGKLAVAVSGGPDSMALAFCLQRWGKADLIALIVDHGLRPESAGEALQTRERLEHIGLACDILRWQHAPITARRHEQARAARYDLLTRACRAHAAADLFLAHHRDDQAETILMRLARGSGIDGLVGMAAVAWRDETRLLRPFLAVAKERLIATCEKAGISFATDPSNLSSLFTRGRLRQIRPLLAEEGLTTDSLIRLGRRAAETAAALDHMAGNFLDTAAAAEIGGCVRIDRAALIGLPRAIGVRVLSACLRYVRPTDYPPEYDGLGDAFDAIATGDATRTIYGCILSIAANRVTVLREPAAATAILPIYAGQTLLWDRRWRITAAADAAAATVRALGTASHDLIDSLAPSLRRKVPQGRVRASLPAIWRDERLIAIPAFDEKAAYNLSYRKRAFP